MTIREEEDRIFEELRQTAGPVVPDGVVCEEEYLTAPRRLCWVLKEVNGPLPDLREFLRRGGRSRTWDPIARWTQAILEPEERPWSVLEQDCEARRKKYLRKIAVINLKKTPGGHTADSRQVADFARENSAVLRRQLDLYAPELILCCGTADAFCAGCFPGKELSRQQTSRGIGYVRLPGAILISYPHPAARVSSCILHYALVDAVEEILADPENAL